ncbi:hypothetical protein TNCV_249711 [Trichonephila clavipes]|nr:hypothetical protein TNCV_249711 [Trichonephila clavipes]
MNWGHLQDKKCLSEQFNDVCINKDSRLGDQGCAYLSLCINDRSLFNGVINDVSRSTNGQTSFFQMNPGSVYSIKMGASVLCGIVVNAHWQRAFIIFILAHNLA